jgi:hypothetical protein
MHSHWFAWFLVDGCVLKVIKSLKTTPSSTSSPSLYLCLVQPNHPLYLFKKKPLNLFLAPARSRNRPPAQLLCWTQTSSHCTTSLLLSLARWQVGPARQGRLLPPTGRLPLVAPPTASSRHPPLYRTPSSSSIEHTLNAQWSTHHRYLLSHP